MGGSGIVREGQGFGVTGPLLYIRREGGDLELAELQRILIIDELSKSDELCVEL